MELKTENWKKTINYKVELKKIELKIKTQNSKLETKAKRLKTKT